MPQPAPKIGECTTISEERIIVMAFMGEFILRLIREFLPC
jgi:hypothetical protein